MQIVRGGPALSDFRLRKILSQLRAKLPHVHRVQAEHLYLIDTSAVPDAGEQRQIHFLLGTSEARDSRSITSLSALVIPRIGTVSPWSSKATDIFGNCGLRLVRRVERGVLWWFDGATTPALDECTLEQVKPLIHDRMTETVVTSIAQADALFAAHTPVSFQSIAVRSRGKCALEEADRHLGLALSAEEIDYLFTAFRQLQRDPTDVELMMFAQANSEHCRHKIFNASWMIDGEPRAGSLFDSIRETHADNPGRVLSAYEDNAAVMAGYDATRFFPDASDHVYRFYPEPVNLVMKVETHNHPTAISPRPGAATGAGGEIRDESATGRGAKPKAGLCGFTVSNLHIPALRQPWEQVHGQPARIASALDIMIEGPVGAASYNNEFGRPALCGYFRTFEQSSADESLIYGYHKPIMLAGGMGSIRPSAVGKQAIPEQALLIVLGGPAMLIGLGGGAASSVGSGQSDEQLDFASVQRDNPEIQRRCQEVIDRCWALDAGNPILSIHDVGAGGLSNALPELVHSGGGGARLELRKIPNQEPGMSPMEIWCNEAQERYVLAIQPQRLQVFADLCARERAPFAVIGNADNSGDLLLHDEVFDNSPIDMPLAVLFSKPPRMHRQARHVPCTPGMPESTDVALAVTIERILQLPAVSDKRFLITIGDRSVGGLVHRDQLVGPWQVAVADCAVTSASYTGVVGEVMALGERSPVAVLSAAVSARLALAEAITNICAARIMQIDDLALSANWMAASGHQQEDANLCDAVAAANDLARSLKIPIPVGKDSLSMATEWIEQGKRKKVIAPLSVCITAFAPVVDVRRTLTPELNPGPDTVLLLIDLASASTSLGGSAFAQVHNITAGDPADLDGAAGLAALFRCIQLLNETGLLLAYHDRSDGGLLVTLCEMAFAARTGLDIYLECSGNALYGHLFNEGPGVVVQISRSRRQQVLDIFAEAGIPAARLHTVARPNDRQKINIINNGNSVYEEDLLTLQQFWSATGYHIQMLRDNPVCAEQEYQRLRESNDPGLSISATFAVEEPVNWPQINVGARPRIAILREQGVNGQTEMAAAFDAAGFQCTDIHMSDLLNSGHSLREYRGIVACGGFSFGDVLGAGGGWAKSILFNAHLRDEFQRFFQRQDSFALGVCNGCQMFARLRDLIPGAGNWPTFVRNESEQFESRFVMTEVLESPSILMTGMHGSRLPIVVAHGEGRAVFAEQRNSAAANPVLRFVDNYGEVAETYPANPNGSQLALTGFTSDDGRVTIMMPHPERVFLSKQCSWLPDDWTSRSGPWLYMFQNARRWISACDG